MIKDVAAWLKKAPPKGQIVEIQNGSKKVKIIPQKIIESLLDELTEQNWSTRSFQLSRWTDNVETWPEIRESNSVPSFKPVTMCDASLELVVTYRVKVLAPLQEKEVWMEKEITRVLVGAVSFDVSFFGNDHVANTAKSLCITNAASDLGRRFGKDLNPKEDRIMILGIKNPLPEFDDNDQFKRAKEVTKSKIGDTLKNIAVTAPPQKAEIK